MKRTKRLLLTLISICIITIIVVLLILLNKDKTNNGEDILSSDLIIPTILEVELKNESVTSEYFTMKALFNNYINWIVYKNSEDLINILSPSYLSEYKINNTNIFNSLIIPETEDDYQYYEVTLTDMLTSQVDEVTYLYIIKGNCRITGKNEIFSVQAMIEADTSNKVYYIYPEEYIVDKGFDKLKIGDTPINYQKEKIINNGDNEYSNIIKTDEETAKEYFNNYKELLMYYKDEAYNKLNTEYSEKRFTGIEDFNLYLKENSALIILANITQYKVIYKSDYTDYICLDCYGNVYIFRKKDGVMKYEVFLDNYTIIIDEFSEAYNNLNTFEKAKYNINKIKNMINTKDYNALYNVLDEEFKAKNFKTVDVLKKFLKNNFYNINTIEITDYDSEIVKYYVFTCKVTNEIATTQSKNITIIMNQSEGTDFTMSFSVN